MLLMAMLLDVALPDVVLPLLTTNMSMIIVSILRKRCSLAKGDGIVLTFYLRYATGSGSGAWRHDLSSNSVTP